MIMDGEAGGRAQDSDAPVAKFDKGSRWLLLSVIILTLASLYPIWGFRFLPMQDYPQHLFLSHVTSTFNDQQFDWRTHYQVDLDLRPYMLWYLIMKPLASVWGVEVAGKLIFSLYIVLIGILISVMSRHGKVAPWGAMLLYPFAFNQMYFMGFPNYILSIPILFLALLDLEKIGKGNVTAGLVACHFFYLIVLLLNHPYTVLVYIGLAVAGSFSFHPDRKAMVRTMVPVFSVGAIFVMWYLTQHKASTVSHAYTWGVSWWPMGGVVRYYLLMFSGMRLTGGPDWGAVALWMVAACVFAFSWYRGGMTCSELRWPSILFSASFVGYLVLPFWLGYYSYFNLRLAPVSYFALALMFSRMRIGWQWGIAVAACSFLLVCTSARTQAEVSHETEQILPVLLAMEKNTLVLPLMYDSSPTGIDAEFFYQFHAHDPNYYHVIQGGGANPYLFPNAMMPVQYRDGFSVPPSPAGPEGFSWPDHKPHYRYFLARGAPPYFQAILMSHTDLIATSGRWQLFRSR